MVRNRLVRNRKSSKIIENGLQTIVGEKQKEKMGEIFHLFTRKTNSEG